VLNDKSGKIARYATKQQRPLWADNAEENNFTLIHKFKRLKLY